MQILMHLFHLHIQWREIITSFRAGMPRRKKRVKIRVSEECFTGHEAVEWLHFHLQTSGNFGTVSREQVNTEHAPCDLHLSR